MQAKSYRFRPNPAISRPQETITLTVNIKLMKLYPLSGTRKFYWNEKKKRKLTNTIATVALDCPILFSLTFTEVHEMISIRDELDFAKTQSCIVTNIFPPLSDSSSKVSRDLCGRSVDRKVMVKQRRRNKTSYSKMKSRNKLLLILSFSLSLSL